MALKLKPLDQQVIVITGASSGIGLATAEAAARQGARLVLVARNKNVLATIVERIADSGGDATYAVADVASREQLEQAAQTAIHHYGRIDTWINDAGVSIYGCLEEVREADSRRLFDTNFWGVVNGSLTALPYLREQGGALINVGSEVSEAVLPLQGMYSASKHAVKGFTDALRIEVQELEKAPVAITLIQPTAVDTPYPEHAGNYMNLEPKLPEPKIDPFRVADAILHAATNEERDVKVGTMSKLNTMLEKFAPSLADKLAAKQAGRLHSDMPARRTNGSLYQAGGTGEIYGEQPRH